MTTMTKPISMDIPRAETTNADWKTLYKVAGIAALAQIALIVIQTPLFIFYPQPTTVVGHFTQFQTSKLIGMLDLDLVLLLAAVFSVLIVLGLYMALRQANSSLMTIALMFGLGGTLLYFASNPTLGMLYLSDQYAAATTDAQRAVFVTAGETLIANYNGTAFALYFIFLGLANVIIGLVMLRSGIFSKATAYAGILMGAMMLVPPLPTLGPIPTDLSYVVLVPTLIWIILIARRFLQLGRGDTLVLQPVKLTERHSNG